MTLRTRRVVIVWMTVCVWGCAQEELAPPLSYPDREADRGTEGSGRSGGSPAFVAVGSNGADGSAVQDAGTGAAGGAGPDTGGQGSEADEGGMFALPELDEIEMPDLVSGIAPDAMLGNLEQSDIDQLCEDVREYQEQAVPPEVVEPALCFLMAAMFLSQGDVQACRLQVDECVSQGGFTQSYECSLTTEVTAGCEATVRQLLDCTEQSTAVMRWFFEQLSCELLQEISGDQVPGGVDEFSVPVCEQLERRCPGIW